MLLRRLSELHRNETGAEEGMNKLLIFALVALPLIALLIYFGGEIMEQAESTFSDVSGKQLDIK